VCGLLLLFGRDCEQLISCICHWVVQLMHLLAKWFCVSEPNADGRVLSHCKLHYAWAEEICGQPTRHNLNCWHAQFWSPCALGVIGGHRSLCMAAFVHSDVATFGSRKHILCGEGIPERISPTHPPLKFRKGFCVVQLMHLLNTKHKTIVNEHCLPHKKRGLPQKGQELYRQEKYCVCGRPGC
jgi:hypothetical protein